MIDTGLKKSVLALCFFNEPDHILAYFSGSTGSKNSAQLTTPAFLNCTLEEIFYGYGPVIKKTQH
jgi:hypothetical protein